MGLNDVINVLHVSLDIRHVISDGIGKVQGGSM